MSGFTDEDVTQAGSAGATTAVVTEIVPKDGTPKDGTMYDVAVSDMTKDGTVIASIPANKATDAAGNDNTVTFIANTPPTANADSYWSMRTARSTSPLPASSATIKIPTLAIR